MKGSRGRFDPELDQVFDSALDVYLEESRGPEPSKRFTDRVLASVAADSQMNSPDISLFRRMLSGRRSGVSFSVFGLAAVALFFGLVREYNPDADKAAQGHLAGADYHSLSSSFFEGVATLMTGLSASRDRVEPPSVGMLTKAEILADSSTIRKKTLIEEDIDEDLLLVIGSDY